MKNILFTFITITILFTSCKVEPEAINYGKDQCNFCKMNIVDKQHAAQLVTQKGKQYKYDAIECMLNEMSENEQLNNASIFLVSDFGESQMIDAATATYLISEGIKSPMGAFLSAFSTLDKAKSAHKEHGGEIFTWQSIKNKFSVK